MAEQTAFDRDFAYLMPFLKKVRDAAERLEPGRRESLQALLDGEWERWTQIQALLAGNSVSTGPRRDSTPREDVAPRRLLTVGALKTHSR
jgi:hypothetical protein